MSTPRSWERTLVRKMVDETAQELRSDQDQPIPQVGRVNSVEGASGSMDTPYTLHRPVGRGRRWPLAAAAAAVSLIAGGIGIYAVSTDSPVVVADPAGETTSTNVPDGSPNTYDDTVDRLVGNALFPVTEPPGTQWVTFTDVNGHQNLVVQSGSQGVAICSDKAPCGSPELEVLRTETVGEEVFTIAQFPVTNSPERPQPLPEDVAEFWRTVPLSNERPGWLTDTYIPGSIPD